MSKDKMPAILVAVQALPVRQRGLVLGVINTLCAVNRYPDAPKALKDTLKAIRTPVAKVVANFDSSKYFVARDGLYVWPDFTSRILPAYQGLIPKRGINGVESIDLTRHMYNRDIVAEYLGGTEEARKHAFTPDQVADLIDAQEDGKAGVLLNNGYANILYIIGVDGVLFPVRVDWDSGDSDWNVHAFRFDVGRWLAGYRILRNKN